MYMLSIQIFLYIGKFTRGDVGEQILFESQDASCSVWGMLQPGVQF